MANSYKHGTYGEYTESIGSIPAESSTVAVYIGTAPVNLIPGYANLGLVNAPLKVNDYAEALAQLGYSDDWGSFTLCEAIKAHFNNSLGNAGPVIFVNVLDPAIHKKAAAKMVSVPFINGSASITGDKIILDTIEIEGKTLGIDYEAVYNFHTGKTVITSIGADPITDTVCTHCNRRFHWQADSGIPCIGKQHIRSC